MWIYFILKLSKISSYIESTSNLYFFSKSDTDPCSICGNPKRDASSICVVEDVRDIIAMERTHEFKGVYHVLHGSISPMNGVGPDDIKLKELFIQHIKLFLEQVNLELKI